MSKLIMVGLLVGSLLAGAAPVIAQVPGQGGVGDPLTLAASGVLMPFFTDLGTVATLQVSSPVSDNLTVHMFFFDADCARIPISQGMRLTTNDIEFRQIGSDQGGIVASGTNGLITIARTLQGFELVPLEQGHPIHARVYQFSTVDGRSRVIEPIILDTAEFPGLNHWWSPLRTGGAFFAPLQTEAVQTDLFLVCPLSTIQGAPTVAEQSFGSGTSTDAVTEQFSSNGFPLIFPNFPSSALVDALIFDTNENPLINLEIPCSCVTPLRGLANIHPIFGNAVQALFGTYTEIVSAPATNDGTVRTTFTGYTSTFTVGSAINAFFARFHNGSQVSLGPELGSVTNTR